MQSLPEAEATRQSSKLLLGFTQPTFFNCQICFGLLRAEWLFPRNDGTLESLNTRPIHLPSQWRQARSLTWQPKYIYPCCHSEGVSPKNLYNFCKNFLFTIHSSLFTSKRDSSPLNCCRALNDCKLVGLLHDWNTSPPPGRRREKISLLRVIL